jgi:hypothetical protein
MRISLQIVFEHVDPDLIQSHVRGAAGDTCSKGA